MTARARRGAKRSGRRRPARRKRRGSGRVGDARRRIIVIAAALTIPAGLLVSVGRTADGTRLAEQLEELRRETMLLEEALVEEVVRVDSLSSRERIGRVADELGLRQAEDHEVVILGDARRLDGEGAGS